MKRTVAISSRAYVFHKDGQLHIKTKDSEPTVPIEDIGVLILEDLQSTISVSALNALMENNCVVIGCDNKHTPNSVMYPISANVLHTAVLKTQLKASAPLMKQLWRQTVRAKLMNQAAVLRSRGINTEPIELWVRKVRSGDPGNLEGRGAAFYWRHYFPSADQFVRDPEGEGVNSALNYGYAIVRAAMARAIVGSGLHPSIGLHHRNQYNPFCLADDLMEPYRPFVDLTVLDIINDQGMEIEISAENKKQLLSILSVDAVIEGERKPLMLSLTATTASLVRCFAGDTKKIVFPETTNVMPAKAGIHAAQTEPEASPKERVSQ